MSSSLASEPAYYFPRQPHNQTPSSEELGGSSISSHSFEWKEGNSWQGLFRNGLPTPPTSKAMTGLTLKNHYNTGIHPPAQSLSKYSHQDAVSGGNSTVERNLRDRGQEQLGYTNRSQRHRVGSSRDFGFGTKKSSENIIASNFRIPESVNNSGGSIAEFAAEITCLFWFESAATSRHAEEIPDVSLVERGLVPDATPSIGFRKWVTTILTTTLVSKNVILLALLFIYRLKKFNPGVSGKRGSEFRLFTIALMLGNKFLDDNTYTNKTWAEVSGISVTEIHIMEVEFLSNMRYNLYVSESDWGRWKVKLGKFGAFFEAASKIPYADTADTAPVTPVAQSFPHKLPSPPSTHHSTISHAQFGPVAESYPSLPNPYSTAPSLRQSPAREVSFEQQSRKRSLDPASELPSAKRMFHPELPSGRSSMIPTSETMIPTPGTLSAYTPRSSLSDPHSADTFPAGQKTMPRLPMPMIHTNPLHTAEPISSHLAPLSLPVQRAMSTVYPPASSIWTQQTTPVTTTMGPFSNVNLYSNPIPNLGNISRSGSAFASATASPNTAQNIATPTRPGLSPSYFLTNRSSPYRPVRNVNTLLIPPPPASLNNPSRNIGHDQIHYQPLSKNNTERRVGVVPYLHHDAWSQNHSETPPMPFQYDFRT